MTREEKEILADIAHRLRVVEGVCEGMMATNREIAEKLRKIEAHLLFSLNTTRRLLTNHDHNMRVLGEITALKVPVE